MASNAERIKQIVAEQLGVDEDQVTTEASFMDDLVLTPWILLSWLWLSKKNSISKSPTKMLKKSRLFRTPSTTSKQIPKPLIVAA